MKRKILFYSDCYIFGGCENLLVNLLGSEKISDKYDIHYAYAWSKEYQAGVDQRFSSMPNRYPLRILSNNNLFYRIDLGGINKHIAAVCKLPFHFLQKIGIYALYNYLRLFFLFKRLKPDLLHINNGGYPGARSCLVAVFSAKMAGVPRIIFNVNNQARKQKNFVEKLFDRYIGDRVDYFTTASSLARTALVERRRIPGEKVIQIFNAMRQESVGKKRAELLAEFGVPDEKFVIATVAFLTERKGQMFLLQALTDIRKKDPVLFEKMVLILVGEGEDRFKIESYIQQHDLVDKVVLTGNRRDYYDFINAADLFVLPSTRDEDMPLVILSAMGLGKIIISTRVAGIIEEIRDNLDGVLLDPSQLHKLADTIVELYYDEELRKQYGASALQRYHDYFALEKIIGRYTDIYTELIDR